LVAGPGETPADRTISAIGEAKAGEELTERHLHTLEQFRAALGENASKAKLLLFGERVHKELYDVAARRDDVEIIDLERLYAGE
jgi:hypothetical protein